MQIIISSPRYSSDGASRSIIEHLKGLSEFKSDEEFVVYYDYPIYSDYERKLHRPDMCVWSRRFGFFAIKVFSSLLAEFSNTALEEVDTELSEFSSLLFAKFVKSKLLRKGMSGLKFDIQPIIFADNQQPTDNLPDSLTSVVVSSLQSLAETIQDHQDDELDQQIFDEVRSIIEGAKVLSAVPNTVAPGSTGIAALALMQLEKDIANFDVGQRQVALSLVPGPHRIRGLAGSGKTIILAAKAALIHLAEPNKHILVTYYTRSLRATLRNLITRFYRHIKDDDPDWKMIHVRHGWGNSNTPGVYRDACQRAGVLPLSLTEAQNRTRAEKQSGNSQNAFNYICRALNETGRVQPYYDYIFIDEGQDFPDSFYQLCFSLAKEGNNEKNIIWAYDELQNILNVDIRNAEQLFGKDRNGEPLLSLDRALAKLPPGQTNDSVLTKCYRNQREVLVTAHALGFGLYGEQIVQMLDGIGHWQDVGYRLVKGEYQVGKKVVLERPTENSPISISSGELPIIGHFKAADLRSEIDWASSVIVDFINKGLLPHHIMVITLDDRNAQTYLRAISSLLAQRGIQANNLLADRYSDPPFWIDQMVTLSTVYRAKGNEAPLVLVTGIDAAVRQIRGDRNKLFTAFTRSKAWLRVSGIGQLAENYFKEIDKAISLLPNLEFVVPDLKQVNLIQRDLTEKTAKLRKAHELYLARLAELGLSLDEAESALQGISNEPKRL